MTIGKFLINSIESVIKITILIFIIFSCIAIRDLIINWNSICSKRDRMSQLIDAIDKTESGNGIFKELFPGKKYRGDGESSWGRLQIGQACIDDVNRIYGTSYVHEDADDYDKARDICRLYLTYWGNHYKRVTGKDPDEMIYSMIWNGGPSAWKFEQADRKSFLRFNNAMKYWRKVRSHLPNGYDKGSW